MKHLRTRAFSSTELLVCVAFLALLVAIVTPKHLKMQTASDVALAKADMQMLRTGLEAYKLDRSTYPRCNDLNSALAPLSWSIGSKPTLERLTTPVSYLNGTTPFFDPFGGEVLYQGSDMETTRPASTSMESRAFQQYFYHARNPIDSSVWDQAGPQDDDIKWYTLESAGPDKAHHQLFFILNPMTTDTPENREKLGKLFYDPTNGTISRGSIWKVGGAPAGTGTSMAAMIESADSSQVGEWRTY